MESGRTVLIIPGLGDSGPQHWQSLWEASHPEYQRVRQSDWECPRCADWVENLDAAISAADQPIALVAHSMGCIAVVHWAATTGNPDKRVASALLVSPPDVEAETIPTGPTGFAPCPLIPLPFKSIVVASTDDPFATLERAKTFAAAWASEFVIFESAGHINAASGHGPWPEGERILDRLMQ
ncbi:MAG: alpha/beta hydrolase [Verrucomicrobia bacterium]|nr:alpha/beta hydrolase [Verrucomicrobiota bacterium]MBV8485953.1 alpha/beta hydrolase [Verrucomicrobiota bacterium]